MLLVDGVTVRYDRVEAVSDVGLTVHRGRVLALLGSNGAGKTSLLRAISGLTRMARGTVTLDTRVISGLRADKIARAGLAHVPEGRRLIAPLTVEQNLQLAAQASGRCPKDELADSLDEIYAMFPKLAERRKQVSGFLSGGEQQMVAIGRGLIARPDILTLDEPSMGLAPVVIEDIYVSFRQRQGRLGSIGIILGEQSVAMALSVADDACVLARGRIVFAGPAAGLDERTVLDAYLGDARASSPSELQ